MPSQRAAWVKLKNDKIGHIGILGIYAPSEAPDRTLLWQEIFVELDFTLNWIILGDFNMIESLEDQRGGNRMVINGDEKKV